MTERGMPIGLGLNFLINDKEYVIPMAVEEPSIVAALSAAAKISRSGGGFKTECTDPILTGQIQVVAIKNLEQARNDLLSRKQEIIDLAEDHQWIHIDPSRAAEESPFKATIAHGYFTLSLYPKLRGLVDPSTPVFPGTKNIINYGINKLRFPGPVISGSSIRANCTLVSVEEVKGSIELIEEYSVEVKDQDRPAIVTSVSSSDSKITSTGISAIRIKESSF